jgi:hypothetical protein
MFETKQIATFFSYAYTMYLTDCLTKGTVLQTGLRQPFFREDKGNCSSDRTKATVFQTGLRQPFLVAFVLSEEQLPLSSLKNGRLSPV